MGMPSTKTILWPSVRNGSEGIVRHLVEEFLIEMVETHIFCLAGSVLTKKNYLEKALPSSSVVKDTQPLFLI